MIGSIVNMFDSKTAKTESEPTTVSKEPENITLVEIDEINPPKEDELVLVSEKTFPKYKKNVLLEVVEFLENGSVLVQNEGDDSDRWEIPKATFESTYDKFEEEVAHTCKSKCDSCEFEYKERSIV